MNELNTVKDALERIETLRRDFTNEIGNVALEEFTSNWAELSPESKMLGNLANQIAMLRISVKAIADATGTANAPLPLQGRE